MNACRFPVSFIVVLTLALSAGYGPSIAAREHVAKTPLVGQACEVLGRVAPDAKGRRIRCNLVRRRLVWRPLSEPPDKVAVAPPPPPPPPEGWGLDPGTFTAMGTLGAALLAAIGLAVAARTASHDQELTKSLLAIEAARDQPRLQILANLYKNDSNDEIAVTVENQGSVTGGPVSVGVHRADGTEISHMDADPLFIEPRATRVFRVFAPLTELVDDPDRRSGSDRPADLDQKDWAPAKLLKGPFIRAHDAMTGRDVWLPLEGPANKPTEPPTIV